MNAASSRLDQCDETRLSRRTAPSSRHNPRPNRRRHLLPAWVRCGVTEAFVMGVFRVSGRAQWPGTRWTVRALVATLAVSTLSVIGAGVPAASAAAAPTPALTKPTPGVAPIPPHKPVPVPDAAAQPFVPAAAVWPTAAETTLTVPAPPAVG